MSTLRPAVKSTDSDVEKIIKYIPGEIIAAYTAIAGFLTLDAGAEITSAYQTLYIIVVCVLFLATPFWMYYAVYDNDPTDPDRRKRAWLQAVISTVAFVIWIYAIGNPILKSLLCKGCTVIGCADCSSYNPIFGSIVLVLFTVITPLIERIVMKNAKS